LAKELKEWANSGVALIKENIPADGYSLKKEIIIDPENDTKMNLKYLNE
jgi:hypothetical protein